MASSLRELRQRRNSVATTKKITRAMELIAASRIVKAQQAVRAALPYADALVHAVSALATYSHVLEHPLLRDVEPPRSAVLVITGDRGLAGAYSANVIRIAEQLRAKLLDEGQECLIYATGNKGVSYYDFRHRPVEQSWTGFSIAPQYSHAKEISDVLIERFLRPYEDGGVDQLHVVATRFMTMLTQEAVTLRLLPLAVEESDEPASSGDAVLPHYAFEPTPEAVLDRVLPMYVANRIQSMLLQSSASELASRQRAMKSATDNAQQLIERLTREANQARQSEITQEISEIVGGAAALAESAGSE